MKRIFLLVGILVIWLTGATAVFVQGDIKKHPSCLHCGMDRQQYAHSRMFIEYAEKK
jgi:hypothetical protein